MTTPHQMSAAVKAVILAPFMASSPLPSNSFWLLRLKANISISAPACQNAAAAASTQNFLVLLDQPRRISWAPME